MKQKYSEYITLAQSHARHGKTSIEIAHALSNALQERYEDSAEFMFSLFVCLCDGFDMPLTVAQSIQHWTGVFAEGHITDDDLDTAFTPWINDYLRSLTPEQ